jgi:hypothetical protein
MNIKYIIKILDECLPRRGSLVEEQDSLMSSSCLGHVSQLTEILNCPAYNNSARPAQNTPLRTARLLLHHADVA